ncbi:MAG: outer membrane protein assembly factor BamD, partial [Treponemataceae bacterium]|nr:outer membrane protein assembly factor BamD [Treponemataceae bacterium]
PAASNMETAANTKSTPSTKITYPEVKISRSVNLKKNQQLVVEYPGNGWIFMGETSENPENYVPKGVLSFQSKKIQDGKMVFTLLAKNEGETIIHFYKNDMISNEFIDDFLKVTVSGTDNSSNIVKAPDYNLDTYLLKDVDHSETKQNTQSKKVAQVEVMEEEPELVFGDDEPAEDSNTQSYTVSQLDELLKNALEAYEKAEFEKALGYINPFVENSTTKLDEGYFLRGQILEAVSTVRDIKEALHSYSTVTTQYPQSPLYEKALAREKYIKRLYFNIR